MTAVSIQEQQQILQSLLTLHSGLCLFSSPRVFRRCSNPRTPTASQLLKERLFHSFWRLVHRHYFQTPDQETLSCLQQSKRKAQHRTNIFAKKLSLLNKRKFKKNIFNFEKWTKKLFIDDRHQTIFTRIHRCNIKKLQFDTKKTKKIHRNSFRLKEPHTKADKCFLQQEKENFQHQNSIKNHSILNQFSIDDQIIRLQNQCLVQNMQNTDNLDKLTAKIQQTSYKQEMSSNSVQQILHSITYYINYLQQKQLAQSIMMIQSVRRKRQTTLYQVSFEQALRQPKKQLTATQTKKLNNLRQISLFKFGLTGGKSCYNFIAPNFIGVSKNISNRMNLSSMKGINLQPLLPQMKASSNKQANADFTTCHHCKHLYPRYCLQTCTYVAKINPNLPKQSRMDLFTSLRLQHTVLNQSQLFKTKPKKCGRHFCSECIKDYYSDSNIIEMCPACQGICICTRCSRQTIIRKFKQLQSDLSPQIIHSFTALQTPFQNDFLCETTSHETFHQNDSPKRKQKKQKRIKKKVPYVRMKKQHNQPVMTKRLRQRKRKNMRQDDSSWEQAP